ncbi:MAG: hypothetical protein A3G32_04525 [Deltaproteobacteria bacterium RIFCSPLOWO2_12_FULL_40_28]|nr:MAG: hypothetical protein A3C45_08635 [Deltaproteobacteria bacterium RIFCSPHIGHO2_02_FULL_40_28]OGQ19636.1 MAG: hypothetical protein A3E27_07830 [Deltaproteobacteria bacterium RIFCSPHIGHO2_12_FULL_40_32]OGQ40913.1 MAG: hypothetical protein A3I69_03245 [Deltaproteobacteria bacterium RIFCSPLOWO2_02_FULL_40_36]OGQ54028.1 MAG: hypothetical protein A3G32_04525 [Deltaproteobacteria bacterium RIFCSPLOWO2_12_FULL_40_28]
MAFASPRKELLAIHRRIHRLNRYQIDGSVISKDRHFKQYEREYLYCIRNYLRVSSPEEMRTAIAKAKLVYVGDYHTLNQSQKSFLKILKQLSEDQIPFVVAMEFIQKRHQRILDHYLQGKISDDLFFKKTGLKKHWFFDLWPNFKILFDFAKEKNISLYAIETNPDEDQSLKGRDHMMAQTIAWLTHKHEKEKIIVFVGDLHIAPKHLPNQVDRLSHTKSSRVILYQNGDAIYWNLAKRNKEDKVHVVRINKDSFCRMHTAPIISQQSYLNWLEHEEGLLDFSDAKHTFLEFLEQMAFFLDITLGPEKEDIEVFTCGDLTFLNRLKESKKFKKARFREIKRQILCSQSYYLPEMKYVYIAKVSINHLAEEASHVLKHLMSGDESPRPMQDAFYANILNEALGFFGSKIINPKRKCARPMDFKNLIKTRGVAKYFLEHEKGISMGQLMNSNRIASFNIDLFLNLTHAIGYYLGERLFFALLENRLTKEQIRFLYEDPFEVEGDPQVRYLELEFKLKGLKLPRKI